MAWRCTSSYAQSGHHNENTINLSKFFPLRKWTLWSKILYLNVILKNLITRILVQVLGGDRTACHLHYSGMIFTGSTSHTVRMVCNIMCRIYNIWTINMLGKRGNMKQIRPWLLWNRLALLPLSGISAGSYRLKSKFIFLKPSLMLFTISKQ